MFINRDIKVIFMVSSPLTNRWRSYFCTDELKDRIDLEYWDCSGITFPSFGSSIGMERDYVRKIISIDQFKKLLKELPKDNLVITDVHLAKENRKFHKLVSHYTKAYIHIYYWANILHGGMNLRKMSDSSPINSRGVVKDSLLKRAKNWIRNIYYVDCIYGYIKFRKESWYKQYVNNRYFRLYEDKCISYYRKNISISILPHSKYYLNHPDYDNYLRLNSLCVSPLVEGKYICFSDLYYPYHPDFKEYDKSLPIDKVAKEYYSSLNRFFNLVERQFSCPVVIAAHPVANYTNNPFEGRQIFYGKTAELVKDAFAVCMHATNSVSYPILWDKPFAYIADNAIQKSAYEMNLLNGSVAALEKDLVYIDTINDVSDIFKPLDREIRNGYLSNFFDLNVKSRNEDLLYENILRIHKELHG